MAIVIRTYDIKIVAWIKEANSRDHIVSSLLFDYLSNIRTLITLRFLEPTEKNLSTAIDRVQEPFTKHMVRNERKRFTTDVSLEMVVSGILMVYVYTQRKL